MKAGAVQECGGADRLSSVRQAGQQDVFQAAAKAVFGHCSVNSADDLNFDFDAFDCRKPFELFCFTSLYM